MQLSQRARSRTWQGRGSLLDIVLTSFILVQHLLQHCVFVFFFLDTLLLLGFCFFSLNFKGEAVDSSSLSDVIRQREFQIERQQ